MSWVVSITYFSLVERTLKFQKKQCLGNKLALSLGRVGGLVGKGDTNFKRYENHTTCIKTQEKSLRCIQVVCKSILNVEPQWAKMVIVRCYNMMLVNNMNPFHHQVK
jgi:hypothetical protein